MRTNKEINTYTKIKSYPVNGHILVIEAEPKAEDIVVNGIYVPATAEQTGSGGFVKLIIVGINKKGNPRMKDLEFNVGDVVYAVRNTLVNRGVVIDGKNYFCIDPAQIVIVLKD